MVQQSHFCGTRTSSLNYHTVSKSADRIRVRETFNLDEVGPWMAELRIGDRLLELVVVGQKEKALAVCVKPASSIDVGRKRAELLQCRPTPRIGEL